MAKQTFIVGSSFRQEGKHVEKGSTITLDSDKDGETIAILNANGRLLDNTPANAALIKGEVEAEARRSAPAAKAGDK